MLLNDEALDGVLQSLACPEKLQLLFPSIIPRMSSKWYQKLAYLSWAKRILRDWYVPHVPKRFRTYDVYLELVKCNLPLLHVPREMYTVELCDEAVQLDPEAIEGIPACFVTEEMCYDAVCDNGLLLELVPDKYKTEKLCKLAVKENRLALRFVPTNLLSKMSIQCLCACKSC